MGFEINMSEVPEGFGGDLDAGNFTVRMCSSPELSETKGDGGKAKLPMLTARFEVLEGPAKGKEQALRYVLGAEVQADGKTKYTPGVTNIKRDVRNATEKDIPEAFRLSDKNAVKWYGKAMEGKILNLNSRKYKPRDWKDGQDLATSYMITGPAKMGQNNGSAVTTTLAAVGASSAGTEDEEPEEEFT